MNDSGCSTINVANGTYFENVTIGRWVTINGSTTGSTVVDGKLAGSVFSVTSGASTVKLTHLTIIHGRATNGGGLYNEDSGLTVDTVSFKDNNATSNGGAIFSKSYYLAVANSTFTRNSATSNGGAIFGYINLTMDNSTFSDNSADNGGAIYSQNGLSVTTSTFKDNSATSNGGAIFNQQFSLQVANSTFTRNSAYTGGAIYSFLGAVTVSQSTFSSNIAQGNGGGIYSDTSPGGSVSQSTFSSNRAANGGGMYLYFSDLAVSQSTFSSNGAQSKGGGIYNYGYSSSPLRVDNSTFTGNRAADGGGLYMSLSDRQQVTLINTIIANSVTGGDCSGSLTSSSHNNLLEDTSSACGATNGVDGNIIGQDPQLGSLANNGGPTQTHALLAGSPAIDAASTADCPSTDQRGVSRPQGNSCDIGAFEVDQPPTVTINQATGQADPTSTSPIHFTVLFNEPVTGFDTGDVALSGTAGATTAVVTGSGTTYDVAVSGMTTSGTVIAAIPANVASDATGNPSTAATSTDNTVSFTVTDTTAQIGKTRTALIYNATVNPPYATRGTYMLGFSYVNNTGRPLRNVYYQVTAAKSAYLLSADNGHGVTDDRQTVPNNALPGGDSLWQAGESLTNQQYGIGVTGSPWQLTLAIYAADATARSAQMKLIDTITLDSDQFPLLEQTLFLPLVQR